MNNEEMVVAIQQGKTELIEKLWENIVAYISYRADMFLLNFPEHYQQLKNDMVNEAYFCFVDAIEKYDINKGKTFISYLTFFLYSTFEIVIYGGRTVKAKEDPLNFALSLDKPLLNDNGINVYEMLADEESEAYTRRLEDIDFWERVRHELQMAIYNVSDSTGRKILLCMLTDDCSIMEASIKLFYIKPNNSIYWHCNKAKREVRQKILNQVNQKRRRLKRRENNIVYGSGIRHFREHNFTSKVEMEAIRKAERGLLLNDILEVLG